MMNVFFIVILSDIIYVRFIFAMTLQK
jgi:hypothetical protein